MTHMSWTRHLQYQIDITIIMCQTTAQITGLKLGNTTGVNTVALVSTRATVFTPGHTHNQSILVPLLRL